MFDEHVIDEFEEIELEFSNNDVSQNTSNRNTKSRPTAGKRDTKISSHKHSQKPEETKNQFRVVKTKGTPVKSHNTTTDEDEDKELEVDEKVAYATMADKRRRASSKEKPNSSVKKRSKPKKVSLALL